MTRGYPYIKFWYLKQNSNRELNIYKNKVMEINFKLFKAKSNFFYIVTNKRC